MSSATARLDALPAETFEHIAQLLPKKDLLALRLVSRKAALKTQREFSKAHFTCRTVLLSGTRSLQRALEVAKHPCFGPCLQQLTIVIAELQENPPGFNGYPHCREILQSAYKKQQDFKTSGGDLNALTTLFSRVRKYGKMKKIVLSDMPPDSALKHEIDGADEIYMWRTFVSPGVESNRSFSNLMEAVTLSGLSSVTNIEMDTEWCIGLHLFTEEQASHLSEALQNVTSLSLSIWANANETEASQEGAARFCNLLASASKLQNLSLRVEWYDEGPLFSSKSLEASILTDNFLALGLLPLLETLSLEGPRCTYNALHQFCSKNSRLEILKLRDLSLEMSQLQSDYMDSLNSLDSDKRLRKMLVQQTGIPEVAVLDVEFWVA